MNNQIQQQIAREAWKEITDLADTLEEGIADLNGDTRFERIIHSAIERGQQYDSRGCELFDVPGCMNGIAFEAAKAQRSEHPKG